MPSSGVVASKILVTKAQASRDNSRLSNRDSLEERRS